MPALEMAQETGKVLRWLKSEGASVEKGEPIMEIETDKVTVEIEAPASGMLSAVSAHEGDTIPVGQTIAWIVAPGEKPPAADKPLESPRPPNTSAQPADKSTLASSPASTEMQKPVAASPVALRMAKEHGIDLALVKPNGARVEKADVLAYIAGRDQGSDRAISPQKREIRLAPASPKARRLAAERGLDIRSLRGSGPDGAVLTADVFAFRPAGAPTASAEPVSTVWRVMAERMSASWTTVPHFYLTREVAASGLVEMRAHLAPIVEKRTRVKPTYTDLLVKLIALVLRDHPQVNASSAEGGFRFNEAINVGIAMAIEDGLIVPVVHNADRLSIAEITTERQALLERAKGGKLRPADISGGTFTLTNLGMYNVDAFGAIINKPQAAILAAGRIADRVVAVNGQPAVRPMLIVTLSCDHRVVDGARAARFLDDLVNLMEEPWGIVT